MKLCIELNYENEQITNFDIAKEIINCCNHSNHKLNARKIAEMILLQVEDGNLEHLWNELKDYLEQTKNNYCDNGDVLRKVLELEEQNEVL